LRQRVELASVQRLPACAREALWLADAICWDAVEHGSVEELCRSVTAEVALADFVAAAKLPTPIR
jgi:hypothetical protein